jgi:TldD protein
VSKWCWLLWTAALWGQTADDPVLRAMRDEAARAAQLRLPTLESPYFTEISLDDGRSVSAAATLGALVRSAENRYRLPRVQVRVGSYEFDNGNYAGSAFPFAGRYDVGGFPLDDAYAAMRRVFWLALDQTYKSSVEAIARKRAALKSVTVPDQLPDFHRAEPFRLVEPIRLAGVDRSAWEARVKALSAIFHGFPAALASGVEFEDIQNVHYLVNSEGTEIRVLERVAYVRARARAQAGDGMFLHDAVSFYAKDGAELIGDPAIPRAIAHLAEALTALAQAPMGETYSGPVLIEGSAAPQFFAQVLGKNLSLFRRPVVEPGRTPAFPANDLEGRIGSRILPEWMDVVDDPTQAEWRGRKLFGHYRADMEGVPPEPLSIVEKGVLKNFPLTRQPQRGSTKSNGRARLPGPFGNYVAGFGNLFVQARETVPAGELRRKLLEMVAARGKPYGLIIRKLDFPASSSFDELRRTLGAAGRGAPVSAPVLAYRVYPDGREELVRGLRFRTVSVRTLRDIQAAADDAHALDFLDNGAPLALLGAGGYVAECTVVSPSVLIDDVDLERIEGELPKRPVTPPPV